MRCLTLARSFRERGDHVAFVSRELLGNLIGHVEKQGFEVFRLPPLTGSDGTDDSFSAVAAQWEDDARLTAQALNSPGRAWDLLVLDHYAFDRKWEARTDGCARKTMVIDDLADRPHNCDLLLDQNYYENLNSRYVGLVPGDCRLLLGPKYSLLRPEFRRQPARLRDGGVKRVLIFFGGMDPTNETAKCLEAMRAPGFSGLAFDVVVGSQNPNREAVRQLAAKLPGAVFHQQVDYMARLMAEADLAVGAGGATTWERCFLGLPCLTVIVADNQVETTEALAARGAIHNLGWSSSLRPADFASSLSALSADPAGLSRMSQACLDLMAGNEEAGVLKAVLDTVSLPAGHSRV